MTNEFLDPALNKLFSDNEAVLNAIKEYKDRVSKDIRAFELKLIDLGMHQGVSLRLADPPGSKLIYDAKAKRLLYNDSDHDHKPLIETPFKIREKMYPVLSLFLKTIIEKYKAEGE